MKALLYNAEMLAAYVAGRKTVTRRLMKPQPRTDADRVSFYDGKARFYHGNAHLMDFDQKPRYHKGELVYIPEPHKFTSFGFALTAYAEFKDGVTIDVTKSIMDGTTVYNQDHPEIHKWRSPRFMPAWAARHFAQIVDVTPERLRLPLSPEELALEGGTTALPYLNKYDGQWVWRIVACPVERP